MKLSFFLVGKTHAEHFDSSYEYYKKRLSKYAEVNIVELKETKLPDNPSESQVNKALDQEAETILKALPKSTFLILMDLKGKEYTSEEFSKQLQKITEANISISFVIGSSYGLSDKVRQKADALWKLSPLTFTHPLAMEITLEQVYRAIKIMKGETYQK